MTDYHAACQAAIVTVLKTALADYPALQNTEADGGDGEWRITAVDDLGNFDVTRAESLPCVLVACVAPVVDRPEFGTNLQSGFGFPIACALFAAGVANGEKSPGVPTPTEFRQIVINTFHLKRLSGVSQVGFCEVGEAGGGLFDKRSPSFQRLSAAMVVQCVGRWPRS